jgi:GT2 family glycosyltransferase
MMQDLKEAVPVTQNQKDAVPVTVVILNTNRRDDTLECLNSLSSSTYSNLSIMVLDNASTDGSVEAIQECCPSVQIVFLADNNGYAGNNNVGIDMAWQQGAGWILVLNEDTILSPDCIDLLVAAGESDPKVGIVGPMVYHNDEPDVIQSAGGVMDSLWRTYHAGQNQKDQGQYDKVRPVEWITGCGLMIRRETIAEIGLIDERFFYYQEEIEWCLRARSSGWKILHVPQAKLWHKGVQREYSPSANVTYYKIRNRFLLIKKHHAPLHVLAAAWTGTIRTLMSWTLNPRWRSKRDHRDAMVAGIRDYWAQRWGKRTS